MKNVVISQPVEIALRTLEAESARKVRAAFDRLQDWDNDEFAQTHSHSLEGVSGAYVLRTNSDMRIFFRLDGNTITILDIARKPAIITSGYVPEVR